MAMARRSAAKALGSIRGMLPFRLLSTVNQTTEAPILSSPRLLVKGLNYETTEESLRAAFARFGPVIDARIPMYPDGMSKGYGFVTYDTEENAAAGIKGMDYQFLDRFVILAEYAKPPSPYLYIGGLNLGIIEEYLRSAFAWFGPVVEARIPTYGNGDSKGYGFVTYDTEKNAAAAMKDMDAKCFYGRIISVQYARKNKTCFRGQL